MMDIREKRETGSLTEIASPFPGTEPSANVAGPAREALPDPLKDTARIFGRSEDEMAKEFKLFKAKKLFRKFDADLTSVASEDELNDKLSETANLGFGSATVLPVYAARAHSFLSGKGVKVFVAVCFPLGEDLPKARLAVLKKTVELPCEGIFFPIGLSLAKGEPDRLKRTVRKAVKICRRKELYLCLECSRMTVAEIDKAVRTACKAGVRTIVTASGFYPAADPFTEVKTVRSSLGAACTVSCCARFSSGDELIRMFGFADRVFLKNGGKIADEIKESLGY